MSYPARVTVGSLLLFLQEQLAKGNVDAETEVFVEVYSLTPEEQRIKARQGQLTTAEQEAEGIDYHVPDECPDDMLHFRMGVWHSKIPGGFPEGQCRDAEGKWANTVALSIYVQKQAKPIEGARE